MAGKTKIAIIEDDIAIVQMYRMKFEAEGFKVETAQDGKSGMELIKNMRPDIALLDIMMPEMNGDEMLKEVRKTPEGKNLKVIVLTNMGENEGKKQFKGLNVLDFIVKADLTPKEVADKVKSLLADTNKK